MGEGVVARGVMGLSTLITHAAIARRSTLTAILRISVAVRRENIGDMSDDMSARARHVHERRQARLAPSPRSRRATRRCATSSTSRARDEIIGYNLKLPRRGRRGRCRAGVSQSGSIFAKAATVLYSPGIYCIPREYTVFPARGACCERSCQELPCRRAPCPPDCATTHTRVATCRASHGAS